MSDVDYEFEIGESGLAPIPQFLQSLRRSAEARLARVEERIEKLGRFGADDFEDDEVLWCRKQFNPPYGRAYVYAFVKADGYWYTSGPKGGGKPRTWAELVEFLSEGVEAVYWANSYQLVIEP